MGRILAPCFGEGIRPTDKYLPHDLEMVFVHGQILIGRGYSSTDECLPLVVERIFVRSRRIVLVWSTPCEYCGDVKMIYIQVQQQ